MKQTIKKCVGSSTFDIYSFRGYHIKDIIKYLQNFVSNSEKEYSVLRVESASNSPDEYYIDVYVTREETDEEEQKRIKKEKKLEEKAKKEKENKIRKLENRLAELKNQN